MIGQTVSHYRIIAKLGAGGMGVVYQAEDTALQRTVALKFLPPELTRDADAKQRFLHEARAAAALDHPNICNMHEIGETAGGEIYLVMACYEGETLRDRIRRGPLPLAEALSLAIQAGDGLAEAHARGVVHRDIKPANLFITTKGQLKILDFGLAKLAGASALTQTGSTLGTVGYLAPEQARGEAIDARTDIWSLGVVLYELVAGQSPFRGEYAQAVIYEILNEAPPPLTGVRTGVPLELERIVAKCLAKDPAERYPHMEDLLVDLRHVRGESGTATPVPPGSDPTGMTRTKPAATGWLTRRPRVAVLVLALLAAALGVTGVFVLRKWLPGSTPSAQVIKLAVLPFENLGVADDAYFSAGVTDEITGRLAGLGGLAVISRSSAVQYAGTNKSTRQIGEELGVAYLLTGTVRWARGADAAGHVRITPQLVRVSDDTNLWADVYDFTIDDIFRVQSEIAHSVVQHLGLTLLEHERGPLDARPTDDLDAYHAYLRGKYAAGQPHFTLANWLSALADFQRATNLDPGFADAWAELCRAHARLVYYRYDLSPERREQARLALESARRLAPGTPAVHMASGYYHLWVEKDPVTALTEFEAASAAMPNNAEVLKARGELFRMRGDWQQALDAFQAACAANPRDTSPLVDVAETCWWMRRYPEAQTAADRAIALAPDQAWPHLIKVYNLWSWKGPAGMADARRAAERVPQKHEWWTYVWFYQELYEGRYAQAIMYLDTIRGHWIRAKIMAAPKVLLTAQAHGWLGETGRAREEFETARRMLESEIRKIPDDGRYHSSLGVAYAALGLREQALAAGRRGIELLPMSRDSVYGGIHVIDLAHIHTLLGQDEEAVHRLEELLARPGWISAPWLEMDPRWKSLRSHPRFQALLKKYAVPP